MVVKTIDCEDELPVSKFRFFHLLCGFQQVIQPP